MVNSPFKNRQRNSDGDEVLGAASQNSEQPNGKPAAEEEPGAPTKVDDADGAAQGSPAEPATAPEVVPLAKYQEALKAKDELLDLLLRRQSEFENLRRRTEREKNEYFEFAHANLIKSLLPILDGLERSLSAPEGDTIENFRMGIFLLLKQLRDLLEAAGLQVILTKGQQFDPNVHHAVLKEETIEYPDNQIIEEYQRGYAFKDRLLRPSMVKVAVPVSNKAGDIDQKDDGEEQAGQSNGEPTENCEANQSTAGSESD